MSESKSESKSKKKLGIVLPVLAALLVMYVIGSIQLGPQWRVDDVTKSGVKHSVTCHQKWHTDQVRTVAVSAAVAKTIKTDDECPG